MEGLGKSLTIPDSVLNKIDAADEKIKKLSQTVQSESKVIAAAFAQMGLGLSPEKTQGLKDLSAAFKTSSADALDLSSKLSSLGKTSEIDLINQKIKSLKELLAESSAAANKAQADLNKINSGGGYVSVNTLKEGKAGASLEQQARAEIAVLEQQKQSIINTQNAWRAYKDELDKTSFSAIRQKDEMDRLNSTFRDGSSELQKLARAQDEANKSKKASRAIGESANSGRGQQTEENRLKRESIALEKEYSRALSSTEGTIAQRTNKLVRLQEVQRKMTESGRDYSTQLARINSETSRLNRANDESIRRTEALRNSHRSLIDTSGQLQRKLALIFSVSQISGYVNKLIEVRGEFELQQRSLQAILQNKEQADKLFGQITELAINSPFRLKELVTYTKQLAAYRVETYKLYDTTKMLADVSAGLGVDMQRLILAYGQVKAANYLRGTELRQFSEAGINILGELSKYFSELEGRAVSVSEVFEMVSKRMVSFGDVETVFKKLTSAGGIFYNMQEIQAETLQGQISNLKDSMDIMFNDIGKANDGVIKDFVGFARTLVENWRLLSDIMKGVAAGMAVYAIATVRAAAAQGAFAASSAASVVAQRGLAGAIVGSTKSIKALFAVLAGNPWILLATAVVGVGSYLLDLNNIAEESRKQFDILTNSNMKQAESLNSLSSEIQANNKEISEANGLLNDGAKGSNDHAKASDRLNSATQKQTVLLQRLKTDFPEVYAGLVKQKDGTIDLTDAQRAYNEQLERTNTLNYLMKQDVGLFGSDFFKEASDADKAYKNRKKAIDELKASYGGIKAEIINILKTDESANAKYSGRLRAIFNSSDTYQVKMRKIAETIQRDLGTDLTSQIMKSLKDYGVAVTKTEKGLDDLNEKYELLRDNALKSIGLTSDEFTKANAKQKQQFAESLKMFINSAKGTQSEYVRAFIGKRLEQDLNIKISFKPKEAEKEFGTIRENINKQVQSINKELKSKSALKPIGVEEGTDDYFGNIISSVKALREEADRATKATNPLYEDMTNASKAAQLTKQADAMQKFANSYGFYDKKTGGTGESAAERKFKSQLDLIKKINSEYNNLLKTTSEVDAKKNIYASFGKAYKDLGLGDIESLSLGDEGTVTKLESMLTSVPSKLKSKLQKEIADTKIQIDIKASKKSTDDLKEQIAGIFDKYELGKGLEKLGLDQSTIKGFFGVDVIDIDSLKKNLSKLNDEYGKSGSDKQELFKDAQDKINDYERKSTIENLKSYTSLLKKSMSERVNVELEGLRKIEEINRLQQQGVIDATKAETLKSGVKEETSTKLDTANWDEFKNSDLYIKMFEDLDYVSSKTLEMMIAKLQTLRTSLKNLPPEDLKEIISQMSKAESELQSRNVFTSLKSSIKGYIDYLKNGKKTQKAFFDSQEKESNIKSQIDDRQILISQLEKEYATEVNKNGETSEGALLLKDQLDASKALLNNYINQLVAQGKISKELANQLTNQQNSKKDLAGSLQQYSQYINQAKEMVSTITSTAEYLFGTMDQGTKDTLDTINEISDGSSQAAEGMSKILKGDVVGGAMDVVTGYFKTVNAIFAVGEKKKERQIQREIKKVEALQKAYEKLEEAIDNAYSIDTVVQSTKLAKENIEAQITAYNNMIAKEEAKKKTDRARIEEWKDTIDDLRAQLKQLEEDKLIALGGIGDTNYASAAEDFASAWLDAFNETGDGMSGLQDKWDDTINNMLKKQVALRVFDKYLVPVMESFDKMFENYTKNGEEVTKEELDNIKKRFEDASKLANDYASSLLDSLGVSATTASSQLSSLTQSLQSASESTMEATNAYLNSIRFFVSEQLETLKRIELIFSSTDLTKNVLLAELKQQTQLLSSINRTFNSIVKAGHPNGGSYAQVKM